MSLRFYRDILGLQVIPSMVDSSSIVWMKTLDGTMVHLMEPPDGEALTVPHIAFEVEDFDATVTALRKSGYPNITDPGERHDGQKALFINDNEGNRLEFTTTSRLRASPSCSRPTRLHHGNRGERGCQFTFEDQDSDDQSRRNTYC